MVVQAIATDFGVRLIALRVWILALTNSAPSYKARNVLSKSLIATYKTILDRKDTCQSQTIFLRTE